MTETASPVSSIDVIPVEIVEPVIEGIKAELAGLEHLLRKVLHEAAELEADVADRERASADERRAIALLEGVLHTMLRSSRDDLDAAVDRARAEAATTIRTARKATDELLADAAAIGSRPAPPEGPAAASPVADLPRWTAQERVEAVARAAAQPYASAPRMVDAPPPPPPPAPPTRRPVAGPPVDKFVQFWNGEPAPRPKKEPRFEWVDALLPVVAVAILLIIVFTYFV